MKDPDLQLEALDVQVQSLVTLDNCEQAWKLLTRRAQPDSGIYLSAGITALRVAADADAKRFLLSARRWADAAAREPLDKALKALDTNDLPGALAALNVVE